MKNQELVQKIQEAVKDMMAKVVISEDHVYTRVSDGAWLQGVSTVSSIVPKEWLSAWGAKEAVKFLGYSDYKEDTKKAKEILKKIDLILNIREENDRIKSYIELLKEAKGASSRKSKTALIDGKAGHLWLEDYIKAKIRETELPQIPNGMLERPLKQFLDWADENVDYWILSEARVAYPEKSYAGTMDALAMMKTGKLATLDFKFASFISEEYHLQTAGYQATFEPYDIRIDERIIIRLPKTLEREEWNKKEFKYEMKPNNIEVVVVDTSYEMDRDVFFAALPVKQWINLMENRKK